jgi:hypothetical protein
MTVDDDPTLPEDEIEEVDDLQDEPVDEIDDDEGERNADEDPEDSAGAADDQRAEAEGTRDVRQPSRAERRIQQALREAKEAKEEVARLKALPPPAPQQPRETPAQRAERLSMMDPDERVQFLLDEQRQQFEGRFGQLQFQTTESADRTAYEALCARNPAASRLQGQVETYLAEMRRNGTTAPRETVLKFLIGERALANAGRANGRQAKRADDNRQRQTARPGNSRSDNAPARDRGLSEQDARRKRLEDMEI